MYASSMQHSTTDHVFNDGSYVYATQYSTTDHFFNDDVETILVTDDIDTVDFNVENILTLVVRS